MRGIKNDMIGIFLEKKRLGNRSTNYKTKIKMLKI